MKNQAVDAEGSTTAKWDMAPRESFTQAVQLIVDGEPGFRAELRRIVFDQQGRPAGPRAVEELLRQRCESRAGLDTNENDMLARFARELLLLAFSSVNWKSLAEKLAKEQINTRSMRPVT